METTTTTTAAKGEKNRADWDAAANASLENEAATKQAGRVPRTFTEKMPCTLTAQELADRGSLLADHYADADKLEDERKNTNDNFKAKIALVEQSIRDLAGTLKSKTELRECELVEEFIFATNTVRVYRADDPEKKSVRERAMTKGERQEELPLPKGEAKPKASKAGGTEIVNPEKVLGGDASPRTGKKRKSKKS